MAIAIPIVTFVPTESFVVWVVWVIGEGIGVVLLNCLESVQDFGVFRVDH